MASQSALLSITFLYINERFTRRFAINKFQKAGFNSQKNQKNKASKPYKPYKLKKAACMKLPKKYEAYKPYKPYKLS